MLKAYVALLIRDQQTELVASYVSQLPAEVATAQYATFLETVTQPELRPRCLQLAIDAGEAAGREGRERESSLKGGARGVNKSERSEGVNARFLFRSGCRRRHQAGGGDGEGARRERLHASQPDAGDRNHQGALKQRLPGTSEAVTFQNLIPPDCGYL